MRAFTVSAPAWKNLLIPVESLGRRIHEMAGRQGKSLSESHPRAYLLLAAAFALVGYLYLLVFPCLVIASVAGLYAAAIKGDSVAWAMVLLWLLVGASSAMVSYCLFRFRPALPVDRELDRTTHPALFQLVTDQTGHYHSPCMDRIVLSRDFELAVLKIPRYALPEWSTHTLVVGLPLLQCLSVQQFQCALARRLGQSSKRYNRLSNWLVQLREIWPLYCDRERVRRYGHRPVAWFYRVYAPLYKFITAPAACLDELAADSYAMELFSDEEVLDTVTSEMVCRRYLEEKFWPVVRKHAISDHRTLDKLQSGVTSVLRAGLHANTIDYWIARTLSAEEQYGDVIPSLARRIDNIGFATARMGALSVESAADVYLE